MYKYSNCLSEKFTIRSNTQLVPDRCKEYQTQCFIACNLLTLSSTTHFSQCMRTKTELSFTNCIQCCNCCCRCCCCCCCCLCSAKTVNKASILFEIGSTTYPHTHSLRHTHTGTHACIKEEEGKF